MVRALGEEFIRENTLPHTQRGELWTDAGWHPTA
jgi:hypothetical protein